MNSTQPLHLMGYKEVRTKQSFVITETHTVAQRKCLGKNSQLILLFARYLWLNILMAVI